MRYFECLVDTYKDLRKGVIYPEDYKVNERTARVALIVYMRQSSWQERTEAEYLAQQDLLDEFDRHVEGGMKAISPKPINDYHDALEAIGDGRIKEIPQHLWDALFKEMVDEDKRRWAIENGFENAIDG